MKLKINKMDLIIIIIVFIFIIGVMFTTNFLSRISSEENLYVNININGKVEFTYKLEENRTITLNKNNYPILLGDMIIEIKDKKVRVKEESSPLHYCSLQGWEEYANRPIVCLPNGVIIIIEGNASDNDLVLPS